MSAATGAVHAARVRPEWIDYNGHLSEPFYVLVFGDATTALMERTGMGEAARSASGRTLYTVEAHVRYLHEVGPDADLEVRTRVLDRDAKRVRLWHEMHVGGRVVATEELMCLHVGTTGVEPFPEDVGTALDGLVELGDSEPEPVDTGRSIAPLRAGRTAVTRPAT